MIDFIPQNPECDPHRARVDRQEAVSGRGGSSESAFDHDRRPVGVSRPKIHGKKHETQGSLQTAGNERFWRPRYTLLVKVSSVCR